MTAFIRACAGNPDLEKYQPPFEDSDDDPKRCILLHSTVCSKLHLHSGSLAGRQRLEMNKQLSAFVRGDKVTVVPAPNPPRAARKANCDIRGLQGYEYLVWEMRFRYPTHYRLVGVVPDKDYFLGLVLEQRENIDWKTVCTSVLKTYRQMLDQLPCVAVRSDNCSDAFTNWRVPK